MLKEWTDTWLQTSRMSKANNITTIYDGLTYCVPHAFGLSNNPNRNALIRPPYKIAIGYINPEQRTLHNNIIVSSLKPNIGQLGISLLRNIKICAKTLINRQLTNIVKNQINDWIRDFGYKIKNSNDDPSNTLATSKIKSDVISINALFSLIINNNAIDNRILDSITELRDCLVMASEIYCNICNMSVPLRCDDLQTKAKDLPTWLNQLAAIKVINDGHPEKVDIKYWNEFSRDCTRLDHEIKNLNPGAYGITNVPATKKDANRHLEYLTQQTTDIGFQNLPKSTSKFPLIFIKIYLESRNFSRWIDSFDEGLRIAFIIYSHYSYDSKCEQLPEFPPKDKSQSEIYDHLKKFDKIATDALAFCTKEGIYNVNAQRLITRLWLFALIFHFIADDGQFTVTSKEPWENISQHANHSIFSAYLDLFVTNFSLEFNNFECAYGSKPKRNIIEAPLIFWKKERYYDSLNGPLSEPDGLPTAPSAVGNGHPYSNSRVGRNRLHELLKDAFGRFGWNIAYPLKRECFAVNGAPVFIDPGRYNTLEITDTDFKSSLKLMRIGRRTTAEYPIHDEGSKGKKTYYCQPVYDFMKKPQIKCCYPQ